MIRTDLTEQTTFPQWIGQHALRFADRTAVTYLEDDQSQQSWTYEQLWRKVSSVAARLPSVDAPSPRAILLFPPGIEFLAGFLGCQLAGWIPVPTCYPKAGREMPRLDSAATDCSPSALICDQATADGIVDEKLCPAAGNIPRIITDGGEVNSESELIDPNSIKLDPDGLALLQYTSGSTSEPKGVMVRHRNLMANLEAIRRGFHIDWQEEGRDEIDCGVFWLPFFHDMGLIGGILEPLYVAGRTVLMSPRSFLQRPIRWLQAIHDYRAVISGAPNFAYQLCVDRIIPEQIDNLDLSRWRIAFSGAEPVRARTLQTFANRFSSCGFRAASFYPCYGLAEATLMAAGGDGPGEPTILQVDRESLGAGRPQVVTNARGKLTQSLVSCGSPAYQTESVLVDPTTGKSVGDLAVGEVWLRGSSIAQGYWNRSEENITRFDAKLSDGSSGYFRTGDLGFSYQGQLYITGRLKDVIILRGRNLFPQDIEATVRETIGSEGGQCAALAVDSPRGEALAVVAELPRRFDESTLPELARALRRAVIEAHEVDPRHVLLVRQATVPLTSSGKVQRIRCREMFDAGEIRCKYRYDRASVDEQTPIGIPSLPAKPTSQDRRSMIEEIETWMAAWLVNRAGVDPGDVDFQKPFADYGLDSMTAVEMSGEMEDWSGIELTPVVVWNHPNVSRLSSFITDELIGNKSTASAASEVDEADLSGLLDELEKMSDDEINQALGGKREST